jgi:hypothetical protein
MGARAFAQRAQAELLATGGRGSKKKYRVPAELTAQEAKWPPSPAKG